MEIRVCVPEFCKFTAMQFIRISTLRRHFPDQQIPVPLSEAEAFRQLYYASELAGKNSIPENEQLLIHLQTEAFVLFMDWTEQERQLTALLEGNTALEAFGNVTNILQHALFPAYRKFITPFLYPVLLKKMQSGDWAILRNGMTYIQLLEEREADLIQHEVFGHMQKRMDEAETHIRKAKTEEELLHLFRTFFTPVLIETLNLFTQSYYRVKTAWLMIFRVIVHHPSSTRRLVVHMIADLRKLDLNKDHQEELRDLEKSVKTGAIKVEDTVNVKRIVLLSLAGLAVVFLGIFIWKLPTKPEYEKQQEETAFMDFTPAERATMDSLLRNVSMERETPDDRIDPSDMDYVGEELVVNIPWSNQDAEYLISQWREHEKDSVAGNPQSAYSKRDTRVFPMTEPLKDKKGSITAKFQNDTELSVFILVFRDKADEWVYGQYLEKQGVATFKLNPGEQLLVLPGSKPPKVLRSEDTPFEQVDSRFYKALKEPYLVDQLAPSKIKLVWKSVNNRDFYLLDLNKALNK